MATVRLSTKTMQARILASKGERSGKLLLAISGGICAICGLLRNLIYANQLGAAAFGTASLLLFSATFVEMMSYIGLDRMVVQYKYGRSEKTIRVGHSLQLARAAFCAIAIILLAPSLARLFDLKEAALGFYLIAMIPVLRALGNLATAGYQRDMNFLPMAILDLIPNVVITILAWPLIVLTESYLAVVILVAMQAALSSLLSHLMAPMRWQCGWDSAIARRYWDFGWPVAIDTLVVFGVMYGERGLISMVAGVEELGVYAVAASIAIPSSSLISTVLTKVAFPRLAALSGDRQLFAQEAALTLRASVLYAGVYAVSGVIVANSLVLLLFDSEYARSGSVLKVLVLSQAFRIVRSQAGAVFLAWGATKDVARVNVVRLLGIGLTAVVLVTSLGLVAVAWSLVIAEFCSLVFAILALRNRGLFNGRLGLSVMQGVLLFTLVAMSWGFSLLPFSSSALVAPIGGLLGFAGLWLATERSSSETTCGVCRND